MSEPKHNDDNEAAPTLLRKLQTNGRAELVPLIGGALSGVTSDLIMHPIDTVRTRSMVDGKANKSLVAALTHSLKTDGMSLFKGIGAVATLAAPASAVYFGTYEWTKDYLYKGRESDEDNRFHLDRNGVSFTAGVVAELAGAMLWTPMDVVKMRLQATNDARNLAKHQYRGVFHAFSSIVRDEGVLGLYKGYVAGIAVYGPFVGIHFFIYERSKRAMSSLLGLSADDEDGEAAKKHFVNDNLPWYCHFVSGFLGSSIAGTVTTPLDVVKTRLQVDSAGYKGIGDAFATMYRTEGMGSFFKGVGARVVWLGCTSAIGMATFEKAKRVVHDIIV